MYAVSHAATALPLTRQAPRAGLWTLLIAVQAIELLWVIFTYTGLEHIDIIDGRIHLGFLPYSHSVGSALMFAAVAWAMVRTLSRDTRLATVIAIAIVSHVVLDIIHHEPDIRLLPFLRGPRLGLGLTLHPLADALVEVAYGVLCWQIFGGSWALLAGILVLNALDLPFMFAKANAAGQIARQPAILTTVVLVQIVVSWMVIWALARRRAAQLVACPR
jgi:hypothetical protein